MADNVQKPVQKTAQELRNIRPIQPDALTWDPADPAASLKRICAVVEAEAATAYNWYWVRKKWKRIPAQWIQFLALTLTALAGLAPVIVQVWRSFNPQLPTYDTGPIATLCVGFAASLLGLDKAFGCSTGWVRFVMAATSIIRLLQEFRMDWIALTAKCANPPGIDDQTAMLQRAKDFIGALQNIVVQESKDWAAEFQNNMAQMERDIKTQLDTLKAQVDKNAQDKQDAAKPGAIELTVSNAASTDGNRCDVTLEGANVKLTEALANSTVWTRIGVAPGQYKATVDAKIGGKPVSTSAVLTVAAGETCKATVAL
jgi:hypothetical protein